MADEQWRRDSDMIFTQVVSGDFAGMTEANRVVCMLYVPDMSVTRAGIAHALGRLEQFYKDRPSRGVRRSSGLRPAPEAENIGGT